MWRVDGKVKEIHRPLSSGKKNVSFDYDAMGNRIAKHVIDNGTSMLEKSTYYILDAQGNTMATYDFAVNQVDGSTSYNLKERHIYGSSRVGMVTTVVNMLSPISTGGSFALGERFYEMTNHLGNVLTVINDVKIPLSSGGISVTGYQVGIVNITDFSGFGVQLDGRTISSDEYRYGFNNKEKDDEIKGSGNSIDFGARIYDPRLGRWLSRDPLEAKYPNISR